MKDYLVNDISNPVGVDFESYWDDQITIKKMGAWKYLHECPEIYLVTISDDDQEFTGAPEDFDWPSLEGRLLVSANASFDKLVHDTLVEKGLIEHARFGEWNCVTNASCYFRGPRTLKGAAKLWLEREIGKDYRKMTKGRTRAMMEAEGNWDYIVQANVEDARAARDLAMTLFPMWLEWERRISIMTFNQCHRGMDIDVPLLEKFLNIAVEVKRSAAATLPWCSDQGDDEEGVLAPTSLAAECVRIGLVAPSSIAEDDLGCRTWEEDPGNAEGAAWVQAMRQWRKANILHKRMLTVHTRLTSDWRFPYAMKYFGAQNTGRWSGGQRGGTEETGFNPQNFNKKSFHGIDLRQIVSSRYRPGKKLIIADAAQIEPRCQAWLTGDARKLRLINQGMSVYEIHARDTMGFTGGNLKREAPDVQFVAKQRVLGLGYACGHIKFHVSYGDNRRAAIESGADETKLPTMDLVESKRTVKDFRAKEIKIVRTWYRLQEEFQAARGGTYQIELPSGRLLEYFNVQIHGREFIAQTTHNGKFQKFYGGKLFENLIQAAARDVFCAMMINVEDYYGDRVEEVFHSHDELIVLADDDVDPKEFEKVMAMDLGAKPSWLDGLPIAAEAVESEFYLK